MMTMLLVLLLLLALPTSLFALKPNSLIPAWAFRPSPPPGKGPGSPGKKSSTTAKPTKLTPSASDSIQLYRAELKKSEKSDAQLAATFATLTKTLGTEESAALACKNVPSLLNAAEDRIVGNFAVYTEKFGADKARGMVERNPSLLFIPTRGYGSAEVAGDDAMAMSYVIGYTRPAGKVLLGALGLALLKAIVLGVDV